MKKFIIFVGIFMVCLIVFSAYIVTEKDYVIITQFGKPVRIIDRPGLYFKLPGELQKINILDKRTTVFNTQPIQLLLGDKNPLILTCYVCWQISDPLLFFQSIILEDVADKRLADMINSQLGSTLGEYTIDNIINTDVSQIKLEEIENKILNNANKKAKEKYGIAIKSVGIRRINYPSIVAQSVYKRMTAEREKEASKYRAEGEEEAAKVKAQADKEIKTILAEAYKEAEIIRGEGDYQSIKIYADAYGKDYELFDFLKSMENMKEIINKETTLILSTESEILKYFNYDNINKE